MLFAPFAIFTELKTFFQSLFILVTLIANALAFFALQFDEVILGHIRGNIYGRSVIETGFSVKNQ